MARIIGIDYGRKRCGISTTDPLQIIVSGLDTVPTAQLMDFLTDYLAREEVEKLVVGLPFHTDGSFTMLKADIDTFVKKFKIKFPNVIVDFEDEQFSSVDAKQIIMNSGYKKHKRREKALVDKVSAVVILQRYLKHI